MPYAKLKKKIFFGKNSFLKKTKKNKHKIK